MKGFCPGASKTPAWMVIAAVLAYGLGSAAQAADPVTHVVTIEGMKFSPNPVKVHPGEVVLFKNSDLVPHTVTEKASKAFDSGILNPAAEWKFTPKEKGTIAYKCTLHPGMEGSIVVEAQPAAPAPSPSPLALPSPAQPAVGNR